MIGVGFGLAQIPVEQGEAMGGYDDRRGGVSGTLDPLSARAITIDDGHRRFALIVFDVICVNRDLAEAVRAEIDADLCWVSATHTHAGPETGCHPGGAPTPPGIRDRLVTAAATAYRRARAGEAPLGARAVRTSVAGLAGTRAATIAEAMTVPVDMLTFVDEHDAVRGILVTVPVHPTVLPSSNTRVSADLAGGIRESLAESFASPGGRPWVVATTGTAGDISTRNTRRSRTAEATAALAGVVSGELADALERSRAVWAASTPITLRDARRTIELPHLAGDDLDLPPVGSDISGSTDDADLSRNEFTRRQGLELARALRSDARASDYPFEICGVALGNVVFIAIPAELFLRLGESIRDALAPASVFVIGYANGYLGYLPDRSSFNAPTYETYASPVPQGSGERVADEAILIGRALIIENGT